MLAFVFCVDLCFHVRLTCFSSLANDTGINLPTGQTHDTTSALPETFEVTAPATDQDAFWMHYGDQAFTIDDQAHHCNFGGCKFLIFLWFSNHGKS